MSTDFYVYEKPFKYLRECNYCKRGMNEGYLNEWTSDTFCSRICAYEGYEMSDSELQKMIDTGELFWTDWHDEAGVT